MAGFDRIDGVKYESGVGRHEQHKTLEQIRKEVAEEESLEAKKNLHSRFDGPGVSVELSMDSVREAEAAKVANQSILVTFRDTWRRFLDFLNKFWTGETNAPQTENDISEHIDAPEAEIDKSLDSKPDEAEEIAAFMSSLSSRKLAKNSDLLTQYNRYGKITGPNASDRRRILQGEGKVRHY